MTMVGKKKPENTTIYVLDLNGNNHEVSGDRPYRKDGTMGLVADALPGDKVEVFLDNRWTKCEIREAPKVFEFIVSCVSFANETDVWRMLEDALRDCPKKAGSSAPWIKIIPPSKQPGGPTR